MPDPFSPLPPPPAPPVVVVEKKRGLGCFGCGCGILLLITVLFVGLCAGGVWFLYHKGAAFTSVNASGVRSFDGGDDMFHGAAQKLSAFNDASKQGQPATLELSADEINTLIARNPDLTANQIHLFVTLGDDHAQLEASIPTRLVPFLPLGPLKDRYLNASVDFTPVLDPQTKELSFTLHHLKLGSEDVPPESLSSVQAEFDTLISTQLQQSPDTKQFLDHAKSISIQGNKLLIETE